MDLRRRRHPPRAKGIGTAESVLSDQRGRIGRAAQSLLIEQR